MRITPTGATMALVLAIAGSAAALDCKHVQELHQQGKRASDIARELAITTPDVQACLAGEVEEPAPAREQASGLPLAPQLPDSDSPIPRPPNQ